MTSSLRTRSTLEPKNVSHLVILPSKKHQFQCVYFRPTGQQNRYTDTLAQPMGHRLRIHGKTLHRHDYLHHHLCLLEHHQGRDVTRARSRLHTHVPFGIAYLLTFPAIQNFLYKKSFRFLFKSIIVFIIFIYLTFQFIEKFLLLTMLSNKKLLNFKRFT